MYKAAAQGYQFETEESLVKAVEVLGLKAMDDPLPG